jgi:hypothetical protein
MHMQAVLEKSNSAIQAAGRGSTKIKGSLHNIVMQLRKAWYALLAWFSGCQYSPLYFPTANWSTTLILGL